MENYPQEWTEWNSIERCKPSFRTSISSIEATIPLDQVALEAYKTRYGEKPESHPLPTVGQPIYQLDHILYRIDFPDGKRWLIKIPSPGEDGDWETWDPDYFESEIMTMQMVREHTEIPIPEVYGFSATRENSIGYPYMFFTYVPGLRIYDLWWAEEDDGISLSERNTIRLRILEQVAAAMAQLRLFTYRQGGFLLFENSKEPTGLLMPYWCKDQGDGVPASPVLSTADFYTSGPSGHASKDGSDKFLRIFADCIEKNETDHYRFTLANTILQNVDVRVTKGGYILGFCDWSSAYVVPESYGHYQYPWWLVSDWDPTKYGRTEDGELKDPDIPEDTPEELQMYRKVYRDAMCRLTGERPETVNATLVTSIIKIAQLRIHSRFELLNGVVARLLRMGRVPGLSKDVCSRDIFKALENGQLDESVLEVLRRRFTMLLNDETATEELTALDLSKSRRPPLEGRTLSALDLSKPHRPPLGSRTKSAP